MSTIHHIKTDRSTGRHYMNGLSRCSNIGKPGVVGGVDAGAVGVTDGGGTVPGTVVDRPGGKVVPGTGGIVVTVHIRFQNT